MEGNIVEGTAGIECPHLIGRDDRKSAAIAAANDVIQPQSQRIGSFGLARRPTSLSCGLDTPRAWPSESGLVRSTAARRAGCSRIFMCRETKTPPGAGMCFPVLRGTSATAMDDNRLG